MIFINDGVVFSNSIFSSLELLAAVPNLFGTRDRVEDNFFTGQGEVVGGVGDGSGGNAGDGELQTKLLSLACHSPPAMQPTGDPCLGR